MKRETNKDRILNASVDLFNQSGTVAITTNHIAKHLSISPGNLYFHFSNKEEIVRELYARMCSETYEVWAEKEGETRTPEQFVEQAFGVFYKYRFFHREMYHLRRSDPQLTSNWKKHLGKTQRLMFSQYAQWVRQGSMKPMRDKRELQFIADSVLITSNAFLNFFESEQKPAKNRSLRAGVEYVLKLLQPYQVVH